MKISIIVPTYNRAKFIEKAIESVLNQTSNSYELVVCDNNSTDNTQEIVKKFESDKIKYINSTFASNYIQKIKTTTLITN